MLLGLPGHRRFEADVRDRSMAALEALQIADYAQHAAGNLPYGVQKRIDLARSLVANPSLLLLDEPAAGLTGAESHQLMELIRKLHGERGFGLLLVEHDMQFVTDLCPRITVIDFGKQLAEGTPEEVRENPRRRRRLSGHRRTQRRHEGGCREGNQRRRAGARAGDQGYRRAIWRRVRLARACRSKSRPAASPRLSAPTAPARPRVLSTVSGIVAPHQGQVLYGGSDVTRLPCEQRVARGIVLCPEGRRLFPDMTVQENLLLGAYNVRDRGAIDRRP